MPGVDIQDLGQLMNEPGGLFFRMAVVHGFVGEEGIVVPNGLAVLAPVTTERPARQRFARIPFALAEMQQAAGSEPVFQSANQGARQAAFLRAESGEVPFLAVHVVDGDEGRLAPHGEARVVAVEVEINAVAEGFDRAPLFLGVGLGDAR